MNMYKLFIYLSLFSRINTQIVSITLCSDYYCSEKCVSWTTNTGKCVSYKPNLGSILNIDSITLGQVISSWVVSQRRSFNFVAEQRV